MNKMLQKLTALSLLGMASLAWANADVELQNRLNKVDMLSADFAQTVMSANGKNVQQGNGKLQLSVRICSAWTLNPRKKHKLLPMDKPFGFMIRLWNKSPLIG